MTFSSSLQNNEVRLIVRHPSSITILNIQETLAIIQLVGTSPSLSDLLQSKQLGNKAKSLADSLINLGCKLLGPVDIDESKHS